MHIFLKIPLTASSSPLRGRGCPTGQVRGGGKVRRSRSGFTLIEMMVAVALFATVMMLAVGALMSVVGASRRSQAVQSVIDNLDFALDDMSRTVRTGTDYFCGSGTPGGNMYVPQNGSACSYIAVEGSHGDPHNNADQIVYWAADQATCGNAYTYGCLMKSTQGGVPGTFLPITSPEIHIDRMSFYVLGACPRAGGTCTGDTVQPRATLFLGGHIDYQGKQIATLNLETNMTQRLYDI